MTSAAQQTSSRCRRATVLRGGWTSNGLSLLGSCSGNLAAQYNLFRLTYASETLKDQGWDNYVLDTKVTEQSVINAHTGCTDEFFHASEACAGVDDLPASISAV